METYGILEKVIVYCITTVPSVSDYLFIFNILGSSMREYSYHIQYKKYKKKTLL